MQVSPQGITAYGRIDLIMPLFPYNISLLSLEQVPSKVPSAGGQEGTAPTTVIRTLTSTLMEPITASFGRMLGGCSSTRDGDQGLPM